jgi:hypothetical protein
MRVKNSGPWSTLKMADLTNHRPKTCQFVMGEDRYMCGEKALPGKPYCQAHWTLTHIPYEPKQDSVQDIRYTRPKRVRTVIGGKWS